MIAREAMLQLWSRRLKSKLVISATELRKDARDLPANDGVVHDRLPSALLAIFASDDGGVRRAGIAVRSIQRVRAKHKVSVPDQET